MEFCRVLGVILNEPVPLTLFVQHGFCLLKRSFGVFECLSNWGEHIGACTDECGGMPDRFCEGETTGPDGGNDGGGIPDIETPN